jgi:AraC-like DNA-binding protein
MDVGPDAHAPDLARRTIIAALRRFLARHRVRSVRVAEGTLPPPQLAYLVNFPRLSLPLSGEDRTELEQDGQICTISLRPGDTLLVPLNAWNRPTWAAPVQLLTFLFGKRQTGISLVSHRRRSDEPASAIKTHLYLPSESAASRILQTLLHVVGRDLCTPADALLVEAILHTCLSRLEEPAGRHARKADRTFQNICLYLQEHFQFPLSRESVAEHFRLSPNHVSRLFRREGLMKFTDYLTWVRIDRAKFLLGHHPALTVDEAALSCGFNDTGYFCRVFKRRTKLTPSEYRFARVSTREQLKKPTR